MRSAQVWFGRGASGRAGAGAVIAGRVGSRGGELVEAAVAGAGVVASEGEGGGGSALVGGDSSASVGSCRHAEPSAGSAGTSRSRQRWLAAKTPW